MSLTNNMKISMRRKWENHHIVIRILKRTGFAHIKLFGIKRLIARIENGECPFLFIDFGSLIRIRSETWDGIMCRHRERWSTSCVGDDGGERFGHLSHRMNET